MENGMFRATGNGVYTTVPEDHTYPEVPVFNGKHYWIAVVIFAVNPASFKDNMPVLSATDLLAPPMLGCHFCEIAYSPDADGIECANVD